MVTLLNYVLGNPFESNILGGTRMVAGDDEATGRVVEGLARLVYFKLLFCVQNTISIITTPIIS